MDQQQLPLEILFILSYVYECFAFVYVCVPHMYNVHGGQKRVLYSLGLELQMVTTCHVYAWS